MKGAIRLKHMEGLGPLSARASGVDKHGCVWIEFEVDLFAEQHPGTCEICGETLMEGWMCLDGGDEVCNIHIEY
jgi:hypothetical protein